MFKDYAPTYNRAYLPLSSGDRIRRLKQTAVASFRVSSGAAVVDGGNKTLAPSTRTLVAQGLQGQTVYNTRGVDTLSSTSGCCAEEA